MYIPDRSWESVGDDCYGGQSTVSPYMYEGGRVAVKVPYLYLTSDFDRILSVSVSPARTFYRFKWVNYSDSAERWLLGDTSNIRTSCRCLVYHWPNGDSRWFQNGWSMEISMGLSRKILA